MGLATFLASACILTRAVSPALVVSSRVVSSRLTLQTAKANENRRRPGPGARSPGRPAGLWSSSLRPIPNKSLSVTVRRAPKGALISISSGLAKPNGKQMQMHACIRPKALKLLRLEAGGGTTTTTGHRPAAWPRARAHACVRVRQKHAACRTSLAGRLSWP